MSNAAKSQGSLRVPRFAHAILQGARSDQQDSVFARATEDGRIAFFVICDGAGGHEAGGEASRAVTGYAETLWGQTVEAIEEGVEFSGETFLRHYFEKANEHVMQVGAEHEAESHAAMVALLRWGDMLYWGHIGDCRLYLFDGPELVHRTLDHTIGQTLVETGRIAQEELVFHEDCSRLHRALGSEEEFRPTFGKRLDTSDGCVQALLCSDGFWGPIERSHEKLRIPERVACERWTREAAQSALDSAGEKADNLSAILVRFGTPSSRINVVGWMFLAICLLFGTILGMLWAITTGRF